MNSLDLLLLFVSFLSISLCKLFRFCNVSGSRIRYVFIFRVLALSRSDYFLFRFCFSLFSLWKIWIEIHAFLLRVMLALPDLLQLNLFLIFKYRFMHVFHNNGRRSEYCHFWKFYFIIMLSRSLLLFSSLFFLVPFIF